MLRLADWFRKDLFLPPGSHRLPALEKLLHNMFREMRPAFTFDEEDDDRCVVRFQNELWALSLFWDESFVPTEETQERLRRLGQDELVRLERALIRRRWGDLWFCGTYRLRIIQTWRAD